MLGAAVGNAIALGAPADAFADSPAPPAITASPFERKRSRACSLPAHLQFDGM
jgi:hypothetical protein